MVIIRLSSSELSLNLFLYLYQMTIDTLIEQVNKAIDKSNIVIAQAVKDWIISRASSLIELDSQKNINQYFKDNGII